MKFEPGQYVKVKYTRKASENCPVCDLWIPEEMKDETRDKIYKIRSINYDDEIWLEGCTRWCFCDHILTYLDNDELEAAEDDIQKRNACSY